MPNYKYNVIIENEEFACDSKQEAEQLKLDAERKVIIMYVSKGGGLWMNL